MKEIISQSRLLIGLSLITMLLGATAIAQEGKPTFAVHNATGVEIHELFVSPHSSNDWENDVLGRDTLPDGESVKIKFNDRQKNVKWDLKVTDGKGHSIEWESLDLSKITEVTLHYKDGKAWATVK
jgi:hypothetical protein